MSGNETTPLNIGSTASTSEMSAVLDGLATGLILIGSGGGLTYLNYSAQALLEIGSKHYLNADFHDLEKRSPELVALIAGAREQGDPIVQYGLRARGDGEHERLLDVWVTPMASSRHDRDSQAPGVMVELVARFADAQQREQERAAGLGEATRIMAQGLAHELRNPLGGIRGAAQLLHKQLTTSDQREYTQLVMDEVDRLSELVTRFAAGSAAGIKLSECNVNRCLEQVRRLLAADRSAPVQVVADYDPSLPNLRADERLLVQALLNLGRNAHQAAGVQSTPARQGKVVLRSRVAHRQVIGARRYRLAARIDVIDDGPGVSEALSEQIFLPLVTDKTEGTGLGLPVAQTLIVRQGGTLTWRRQDGLTVFTVLLPISGEV